MTKLFQWLIGLCLFVGIWLPLIKRSTDIFQAYQLHIWLIPVYCLALFGFASLGIIIHRVYTFNDCPNAAAELKKEINEAREDLKKRGFMFDG
ncbi:dolichol-phosphate mannosyltransferase subunit 3 [Centruroides vittatus]|uniref:dolichol-phosphate mannosyltransferase subunit 3 n=1 Tax=Centruroides vittatus TaxID=120091 RepID=UPI00351067DC